MKQSLTISLILLLSIYNLFAQKSHIITVGFTKFQNVVYDYTRNYGITTGYEYENNIAGGIFLKAGLTANFTKEEMIKIYPTHVTDTTSQNLGISYVINDRWTDKSEGWSLSLQLPVNIKISLFHPRVFVTGGIMLSADNVWVNSQIYSLDPSLNNNRGIIGELNKGRPKTSLLGFGHQFGLTYDVSKRFELYAEYKTSANNEFSFNYFEFGIKCKTN